jgi:SAM-dependent methyltransferase
MTWAALPLEVHLFYARAYLKPGGAPWERAEPEREALQPFLQLGGRALDLGCGGGRNALHLAAAGWTVEGVDVYRGPLRRARRRAQDRGLGARARFLRAAASTHLEASAARYDLILDVLGPASDLPTSQLGRYGAALAARLAPGGCALVYTFLEAREVGPLFGALEVSAAHEAPPGRWWRLTARGAGLSPGA